MKPYYADDRGPLWNGYGWCEQCRGYTPKLDGVCIDCARRSTA